MFTLKSHSALFVWLVQEVTVDSAHIRAINDRAARLEKRQRHEELRTVRRRRQQLNDRSLSQTVEGEGTDPSLFTALTSFSLCFRWGKFHVDLSEYKEKIQGALAVHELIRELEELRDRANEKVTLQLFEPVL